MLGHRLKGRAILLELSLDRSHAMSTVSYVWVLVSQVAVPVLACSHGS